MSLSAVGAALRPRVAMQKSPAAAIGHRASSGHAAARERMVSRATVDGTVRWYQAAAGVIADHVFFICALSGAAASLATFSDSSDTLLPSARAASYMLRA